MSTYLPESIAIHFPEWIEDGDSYLKKKWGDWFELIPVNDHHSNYNKSISEYALIVWV